MLENQMKGTSENSIDVTHYLQHLIFHAQTHSFLRDALGTLTHERTAAQRGEER